MSHRVTRDGEPSHGLRRCPKCGTDALRTIAVPWYPELEYLSCDTCHTRTDANRCGLRGTQDDLATALVSVVGLFALPTTVSVAFLDTGVPDSIGYPSALPSDWIVPPDPPPPRN